MTEETTETCVRCGRQVSTEHMRKLPDDGGWKCAPDGPEYDACMTAWTMV